MSVPVPTPVTAAASRRGFLLVVVAALCWGTAGFSSRIVSERSDLGPLDIAWYRMAVGALVLLVAHLLTPRRRRSRIPLTRPLAGRLALVAAGLAAYQLAYFAAVAQAGVSIPTLVALGLAPLLIALGGTVLGHARPDRATTTSMAAALVGLVLLVGVEAGAGAGTSVLLGALLAVGSALGYALVTLAGGGVPNGVPVTLAAFGGGALLLSPAALAAGLRLPHDPVVIAVLLYLGVVPSAVAYGLFFTGIRAVPGPVASIVTLLEPLTATVLATTVLGETLAPWAVVGGLLLLAAVAALYLRRLRETGSPPLAAEPLAVPEG